MSTPTPNETTDLPRLRWRRSKASGFNGPDTYELSRGERWIARAQQNRDGTWFWYGAGRNTANRPMTLEAAKAEAAAYVKEMGL
ncbi:MAG: hypothetical protein ACJ8HI_13765 [Massilia sp.]|jgi:hypothetical protein